MGKSERGLCPEFKASDNRAKNGRREGALVEQEHNEATRGSDTFCLEMSIAEPTLLLILFSLSLSLPPSLSHCLPLFPTHTLGVV